MVARTCVLLFVVSLGLCVEGIEAAAAPARRLPLPEWIDVVRGLPVWGLIIHFYLSAKEQILKFVADPLMMQLVLGVAVILVGAVFIPDLPVSRAKEARSEAGVFNSRWTGKISFKGTPRYAVLLAGLSIVFSALWRSYSRG